MPIPFEATKSLSGARELVKVTNMELDSLDGYTSPVFDNIGGRSSGPSDRLTKLVLRRDRLRRYLTNTLEHCLRLEEASKAELESVDNLELRSMIYYREVCGMTWAQIGKEMNMTADAAKKRYERGMRAYLEQGITVSYPEYTEASMNWLHRATQFAT